MRIIKIIIAMVIVSAIGVLPGTAQTAKNVLDKTAAKLKSAGGISANFVATSFKGTTANGSTTGNICVQEDKFKITSGHSTTWFNGKTQWSMTAGSNEAYVSTPTESELQSINPYTFVNLYKSGYSLSVKPATYRNQSCHEVRLLAKSGNKSIPEMLITIDKGTYMPHCVRVRQSNGTWLRIQISGLSVGKVWDAAFFEFNKKEYPQVDVIDLR